MKKKLKMEKFKQKQIYIFLGNKKDFCIRIKVKLGKKEQRIQKYTKTIIKIQSKFNL